MLAKMTPNEFRQELNNCLDLLLAEEIARAANPVVVDHNGRKARVTWRSPNGIGTLQATYPFASIDEYCEHLRNQAYSAILLDGSLLQITYEFYHTKLIGHRLCFYPCPFDLEPGDFDPDPLLDVVAWHRDAGSGKLRLRSPVRFDYDPAKAREGHPAVHVHLLWAHCRCAVDAPLSLGHFLQFVFCNFFPSLWMEYDFLRKWKKEYREKTISSAEATCIHFSAKSQESNKLLRRRPKS
jgi:hypothetical protein